MNMFARQLETIQETTPIGLTGRVASVAGLRVVANDFPAPVGSMCRLLQRTNRLIEAQVVGFSEGGTILLPLDHPIGVTKGDRVELMIGGHQVAVGEAMLGRVLDGRGELIDGKGNFQVDAWKPLRANPPKALGRPRICEPLSLGIRSIDSMLTVGRGQRMGIFAGTGVGKSVLLGMVARYTEADVTVVALVGERGPEHFIPDIPGKIIPNSVSGVGQPQITINNNVDARGAAPGVHRDVIRALEQLRGDVPKISVNAVVDARRRNPNLFR